MRTLSAICDYLSNQIGFVKLFEYEVALYIHLKFQNKLIFIINIEMVSVIIENVRMLRIEAHF